VQITQLLLGGGEVQQSPFRRRRARGNGFQMLLQFDKAAQAQEAFTDANSRAFIVRLSALLLLKLSQGLVPLAGLAIQHGEIVVYAGRWMRQIRKEPVCGNRLVVAPL